MKEVDYFIVIVDKVRKGEFKECDFHLEKLISFEAALETLNNDENYEYFSRFILITNNNYLIDKYEKAIKLKDFETLCFHKKFDPWKTEITFAFGNFDFIPEIYYYVNKLLNCSELYSVSMDWDIIKFQPWDDYGPTESSKEFNKWIFNEYFLFFNTPSQYVKNNEYKSVFYLPITSQTRLETLNKILNCDILNIKNNIFPELKWGVTEEYYKYYDKISKYRFFITPNQLQELEKQPNLVLKIETKIDKHYYIEFYVKSLLSKNEGREFEIENSFWDSQE
jgi:hypothetical protein